MYKRLYQTVSHIFRYRYWAYDSEGKFTDTSDCISYSIVHFPIPILILRLYRQISTNISDCIGWYWGFWTFKAILLQKKYLLMRWSDCIASKSSFWSNEVTFNVLKSMKKIGRYNRKIGIGIGSSEGQNFAHLWPRHRGVGAQLKQTGRRVTKGATTLILKVALLPAQTSILFVTLAMACVSFTTTTPTRPSSVFHPVLGRKTKKPPDPYRFGGNINTCHCHGHAFPGKSRTHYSHRWTDSWQVFGWHWVTLSIVPCNSETPPSGPLLKRADGQPFPSRGFVKKTVQFQGELFSSQFLQAAVAGPVLGIDFLRRFKSLLPQRPAKYFLLALQRLRPPLNPFCLVLTSQCSRWFHCPLAPLHRPLHRQTVSIRWNQPVLIVREHSPLRTHPTPLCQLLAPTKCSQFQIQCLQMSKFCFKNFPPFWEPGMWSQHQGKGLSITSTPAATPQFLQSPAASPLYSTCI